MGNRVIDSARRARYLAYLLLTAAMTALMILITVRFALQGGEGFETGFLAVLTLLLGFQTRRWYRRFRAVGNQD